MLLFSCLVHAQQDQTLYFMPYTPQANYVNPANGFHYKTIISIPGLSSIHGNYNNTFIDIKDMFIGNSSNDSLLINLDHMLDKMHNREVVNQELHYNWFFIGHHYKNNYFTFSVSEKQNLSAVISEKMVRLFWRGNTDLRGDLYKFSGTLLNMNHYREFAFGFSKNVSEDWRFGMKAKLLLGMSNVFTSQTKATEYTNDNTFAFNIATDGIINANLPVNYLVDSVGNFQSMELKNDFNALEYLLQFRNPGMAFDFGFVYKPTSEWTISGSVLDLGLLFWQSDPMQLITKGEMYYTGSDDGSKFSGGTSAQSVMDSIVEVFWLKPVEDPNNYLSFLTPDVYLGATYQMSSKWNVGGLLHAQVYRNRIRTSFTASANGSINSKLSTSVSYTLQNGSAFNMGAGFSYELGKLQLHAVSDNIPGLIFIDKTRNINFRFGASLMFGLPNDLSREDKRYMRTQDPFGEYLDLRNNVKRKSPRRSKK